MPNNIILYGKSGSGKSLVANVLALYKTRLTDNKVIVAHDKNEGLGIWQVLFDECYTKNLIIMDVFGTGDTVLAQVAEKKPKVVIVDNYTAMYYNMINWTKYEDDIAKCDAKMANFVNTCNNYGSDVILTASLRRLPNTTTELIPDNRGFIDQIITKPKRYVVTREPDINYIVSNKEAHFYLNEPGESKIHVCSLNVEKPKLFL